MLLSDDAQAAGAATAAAAAKAASAAKAAADARAASIASSDATARTAATLSHTTMKLQLVVPAGQLQQLPDGRRMLSARAPWGRW